MANIKGRQVIGLLFNVRIILVPHVLLSQSSDQVERQTETASNLLIWLPECVLQISVANIGPVSCAVHVRPAFMRYSDGVYSSDECESTTSDVNHAVVIVGYGTTDDGIDYWLMLNRSVPWTAQDHAISFCFRTIPLCGKPQATWLPSQRINIMALWCVHFRWSSQAGE